MKVEPRYLLDLGVPEAQFLQDLFGNIGGDPNNSRRWIADTLASALEDAGVARGPGADMMGTIRCGSKTEDEDEQS